MLLADSPTAGSESDPVVSKSYVDAALDERIQELEAEVAQLNVKAQAMQTMINELQSKVNKTPTTSGSSGSSSSAGTSSGSSTTDHSAMVGKTVYVQQSNNYVNLRDNPSTEGTTVIKRVEKGEAMLVQEVKNDWYQVRLADNTVGWVAGWLVQTQ